MHIYRVRLCEVRCYTVSEKFRDVTSVRTNYFQTRDENSLTASCQRFAPESRWIFDWRAPRRRVSRKVEKYFHMENMCGDIACICTRARVYSLRLFPDDFSTDLSTALQVQMCVTQRHANAVRFHCEWRWHFHAHSVTLSLEFVNSLRFLKKFTGSTEYPAVVTRQN